MQPSQQRTTGRTGTGGSGRGGSRITTESQGITLGNKPVSNPYQGYQPKTQPITANNTLSPEYIAQNGFTGSGDKPATGEQPDWKDYLTYGTVVAGGILGADQIGKLLKTSQNSLVRSAGRLFKPNVVNITENPAVERGVSRLAGKEGKMLLNRGQVKTNTPQNPAANQQNPTYSPEVQVNTPAVTAGTRSQKVPVRGTDTGSTETRLTSGGNTRLKPGQVAEKPASNLETPFVETPALKSVSVGSPLKDFKLKGKNWADYSKEDRQHEGRTLAKILETKGDDYKGEGYQAEILQELKKSNPNIVKELRDAKGEELEKLIQKYFKKGGLVRKHQFGKKLVEGTKKAGKEAVTDTVIGNALDSRKSDRDFDMIDAVSLGASFVPGLNVASAAFDAGRNLYDEYKAGDLDSKDFVRNGLDFTTNLIPGAKAAKGAFKVTKQLMKPKTAAKVANLSKLIFTN
jgi:hypothetical protein